MFQRCFNVVLNFVQNQINVVYTNVGIYNVEQRRINIIYFNIGFNNVRQRRNNLHFQRRFTQRWIRRNNFLKKMNTITGIFQVICLHLWSACFKVDLKGKSHNLNGFEGIDITLLKVSCSLFSAVAVCTLNWWMLNLLRNKEESFNQHRLLSSATDKKIYRNTEWKHIVESAVHGLCK